MGCFWELCSAERLSSTPPVSPESCQDVVLLSNLGLPLVKYSNVVQSSFCVQIVQTDNGFGNGYNRNHAKQDGQSMLISLFENSMT